MSYHELGVVVTELSLLKRSLKVTKDIMCKGDIIAELELQSSPQYIEINDKIKVLQSSKIKLLNKCKKDFRSEL